ncbi:phage replisome organizer N-terminal domain-containing protein [Pediococcus stilesii]|nr:phage replisome organizer N-terminal domain-containing protein [Pediococcus stilesii]
MTKAKRFYWLKLDPNFFQGLEIKLLKKTVNGHTYIVIYLELLLHSLENEGFIYFEGIGENLVEELALKIDEEIKDVQNFLDYAESKGLIEYGDNTVTNVDPVISNEQLFKFTRIDEMTGTETDSARRTRRIRERNKILQILELPPKQTLDEKSSHCDEDVTPVSQSVQKGDIE